MTVNVTTFAALAASALSTAPSGNFLVGCNAAGTADLAFKVGGANGIAYYDNSGNIAGGAVSSVFGRNGAVTAQTGDYSVAQVTGAAALASPAFTGTPTAPTAAPGTSTTQLATTAFVATSFAPLASPALTGNPTAPTQTAGDNSTKISTTAFVATSFAPLASPTFTGTPAAPTAATGTNTTQLATTAFVQAQNAASNVQPAFKQTATQTIANSTAETTLFGSGAGSLTLAANKLAVGTTLKVRIIGVYSTQVTPGNITGRIKLGGVTLTSFVNGSLGSGVSTLGFEFEIIITCRTTGVSGTVMPSGYFGFVTATGGARNTVDLNAAGSVGTVNTTGTLALDVTWQWTTGSSSNTVSSFVATVEVLP